MSLAAAEGLSTPAPKHLAAQEAHRPAGGRAGAAPLAAGSGGEEGAIVAGHGPLVEDDLPVARPHQADGLPRPAPPRHCPPVAPACTLQYGEF